MVGASIAIAAVVGLMLPTAFRSWVRSHEVIPYTYSLGYNLYVGNGPLANGTFVLVTGSFESAADHARSFEGGVDEDGRDYIAASTGKHLTARESSRFWTAAALDNVAAHPRASLGLFIRKLALLFNHRELPQAQSLGIYERVIGPFGMPVVGRFVFIGSLGLFGMLIALRRGPEERFIGAYVLSLAISTSLFFITDRYRYHLLPALFPLAAIGLRELTLRLRARRWPEGVRSGLLFAACLAVVLAPLVPADAAHEAWDTDVTLGDAWLQTGRPDLAIEALHRAVARDASGTLVGGDQPSARTLRASVYETLGRAELATGQRDSALAALKRDCSKFGTARISRA